MRWSRFRVLSLRIIWIIIAVAIQDVSWGDPPPIPYRDVARETWKEVSKGAGGYDPLVNDCDNISNYMMVECRARGLQTWGVSLVCANLTHAMNIVLVRISGSPQYCLADGNLGVITEMMCWPQIGPPPPVVPSGILDQWCSNKGGRGIIGRLAGGAKVNSDPLPEYDPPTNACVTDQKKFYETCRECCLRLLNAWGSGVGGTWITGCRSLCDAQPGGGRQ